MRKVTSEVWKLNYSYDADPDQLEIEEFYQTSENVKQRLDQLMDKSKEEDLGVLKYAFKRIDVLTYLPSSEQEREPHLR